MPPNSPFGYSSQLAWQPPSLASSLQALSGGNTSGNTPLLAPVPNDAPNWMNWVNMGISGAQGLTGLGMGIWNFVNALKDRDLQRAIARTNLMGQVQSYNQNVEDRVMGWRTPEMSQADLDAEIKRRKIQMPTF